MSATTAAIVRAVAAVALLCGLVACSDASLKIDAEEVNGPGTLGLSASARPVNGLAIYFHGAEQTRTQK
jgi:hypothetical protein